MMLSSSQLPLLRNEAAGPGSTSSPGAALQCPDGGGVCAVDQVVGPVPRAAAPWRPWRSGRGGVSDFVGRAGQGSGVDADAGPGGDRVLVPGGIGEGSGSPGGSGAGAPAQATAGGAHSGGGEGGAGAHAGHAEVGCVGVVRWGPAAARGSLVAREGCGFRHAPGSGPWGEGGQGPHHGSAPGRGAGVGRASGRSSGPASA